MESVKFSAVGDTAINVEFGNEISPDINRKIRAFNITLKNHPIASSIVETVPTYRSILIHYRPECIRYETLTSELKRLVAESAAERIPPAIVVELPVLYGGEYGPDLEFVASHNNLTSEEVIQIHTSKEYLIYMLGFTPGFPYLGGMDERIATPRLSRPRLKIPGGSVGIAGSQTGVYPIVSPGGWQLIGRTPVSLYDVNSTTPILLEAGQYIKFVPITEKEFGIISNAVSMGNYQVRRYSKEG